MIKIIVKEDASTNNNENIPTENNHCWSNQSFLSRRGNLLKNDSTDKDKQVPNSSPD